MKTKKRNKKSMLLCMMLIVAMAFTAIGCGSKNQGTPVENSGVQSEKTVLGSGKTAFEFVVVDADGNETAFEIHTDKEMVGDALLEQNLVEGEQDDFGLYVKTVNGITADYDTDKTYWAFYVNGEYAMSGVDTTPITDGDVYSFKVEK